MLELLIFQHLRMLLVFRAKKRLRSLALYTAGTKFLACVFNDELYGIFVKHLDFTCVNGCDGQRVVVLLIGLQLS